MLEADLDRITEAPGESTVQLLPTFDPYLMGHNTRDHLFASEYRARVSRVAGWISAVVLVDGRVVATWTHQPAKKTLNVTVEPFKRLSSSTVKKVRLRAQSIASALGLDEAAVRIA